MTFVLCHANSSGYSTLIKLKNNLIIMLKEKDVKYFFKI